MSNQSPDRPRVVTVTHHCKGSDITYSLTHPENWSMTDSLGIVTHRLLTSGMYCNECGLDIKMTTEPRLFGV